MTESETLIKSLTRELISASGNSGGNEVGGGGGGGNGPILMYPSSTTPFNVGQTYTMTGFAISTGPESDKIREHSCIIESINERRMLIAVFKNKWVTLIDSRDNADNPTITVIEVDLFEKLCGVFETLLNNKKL